jgi:hypothetical protein
MKSKHLMGLVPAIVAFTAPCISSGAAAADYDFISIADPLTTTITTVGAVNNAGTVVGYYQAAPGTPGYYEAGPGTRSLHGFIYHAGTFTTIGDPSATNGETAYGANDSGVIVGEYDVGIGAPKGYIDNSGVFTTIQVPTPSFFTIANGINNANVVVGSYDDPNGEHGFTYSGGVLTSIDDPFATQGTGAVGISNTGVVVGSYYDATGAHGFVENGGVFTTIDDPLAYNGSGGLGSLTGTGLTGINSSGDIVGIYYDAGGVAHSFVDHGGVFEDFDTPYPATGEVFVTGINDVGQIVGNYDPGDGTQSAFLATPVPEPAAWTLMLLGFGVAGATMRARRREGLAQV